MRPNGGYAIVLAFLWCVYTLCGALGGAASPQAHAQSQRLLTAAAAASQRVDPSVHRCGMCGRMGHGKMACCCASGPGRVCPCVMRSRGAVEPSLALAVVPSWPVVIPDHAPFFVVRYGGVILPRALSQSVSAIAPAPPTPPPCLL